MQVHLVVHSFKTAHAFSLPKHYNTPSRHNSAHTEDELEQKWRLQERGCVSPALQTPVRCLRCVCRHLLLTKRLLCGFVCQIATSFCVNTSTLSEREASSAREQMCCSHMRIEHVNMRISLSLAHHYLYSTTAPPFHRRIRLQKVAGKNSCLFPRKFVSKMNALLDKHFINGALVPPVKGR